MLRRFREVFWKELILTFRDASLRSLIIAPPLTNILVFGYALSMDVQNIRTVVMDRDNSAASRSLVSQFEQSGYFDLIVADDAGADVGRLFDAGEATAVLVLDAGFQAKLDRGGIPRVQLLVDGTDSTTASVVLDYGNRIVTRFSETWGASLDGPGQDPARVAASTRAWFNENLRSRDYYLAAVICTSTFLATLTLTGLAVVRERELGTIEQVMVSPLGRLEFLLGKTTPFALIGLGNLGLMLGLAVLWFDTPVRGSVFWLFAVGVPYLLSAVGMGLLISVFTRTQQQAMIATFFVFVPLIFFSGFIYPIASMPQVLQDVSILNPMRHAILVSRGILLKGIGPELFWKNAAILSAITVVTTGLALTGFRKTYI